MTDAINMLKTAYKALDDKKAYDIKILDIKKISSIADYMVIADGTNKNQVQAMCDAVTEEMGKAGFLSKSIEGYSEGGWILLDYYDIIIHIFSDEARRFYDIERIWSDGKYVDISEL
ncbi:iojap-like protein [Coprococcus sp. CAG:782]|uniref:ribosome silencing factor n=1 Tax=Coprococcus sp. OM04-5BH TaxID=2293093 RepID=UPI000338A0BB|nr:ribosome silencing factor [Coprococcus sp. OM04-5BH]MEE0035219.1 ribosome silencing factor [Coprococcus sp.]RHV32473.1 ribosome silencing factor [Coprococcus sp. OM04-5BH]CCY53767.1 iojap-like protein [Coprococcus sp. CAG:782]